MEMDQHERRLRLVPIYSGAGGRPKVSDAWTGQQFRAAVRLTPTHIRIRAMVRQGRDAEQELVPRRNGVNDDAPCVVGHSLDIRIWRKLNDQPLLSKSL